MPLLGFGVYQNYNTRPSVLTAFEAGYRYIIRYSKSLPKSDLLLDQACRFSPGIQERRCSW